MKTISLKIPAELDDALTELAERRHSSRSALLREAVERMTRRDGLSVAELAGDLVGSLDGPEDLSTSKARMAGFGK